MTALLKDIHFGIRVLLKHPWLTVAALLCLGLGIGATVTMFTMVNATLIQPLPYKDAKNIVWIMETGPKRGFDWLGISYPNFRDWQEQNRSYECLAVYQNRTQSLAGGDEPRRVQGLLNSADLFRVLGIEPIMGRNFTSDDDLRGAELVVMLSYQLWQTQFGADPDVVGRSVTLQGSPHTVIGVMPAGFAYPENSDLWLPMSRFGGWESRDNHSLEAIGRLRDGVSLEQALVDFERIIQGLREAYPEYLIDNGIRMEVLPKRIKNDFATQFLILMGAVVLVLLIACANVANLLLARAAGRGREIAIRRTLGAGGLRLVRQLLTESVLLGLCGGVVGLVIGKVGLDLTLSITPVAIPTWMDFSINGFVILILFLVSILTGLIFGMAPVSQMRKTDLTEALKEGGAKTAGGSRHLLRNTLIIGEVAVSLMLLVNAGLLIQGYIRLQTVSPGFTKENMLAVYLDLPESQYPEEEQRELFYRQALERLEAVPGIASAGMVLTLPMAGSNWGNSYSVEEFPIDPAEPLPVGNFRMAYGRYFETMEIPLLQGRLFNGSEDLAGGQVVIVNETFAEKYWPDTDPIGKRIALGRIDQGATPMEIVGVVGGVRHYGLDRDIREGFYFPHANRGYGGMWVVVRTLSDPHTMIPAVRETIWSLDPTLPLSELRPMKDIVAESTWGELIFTRLLSAFAVLALVLAMLGVYGVMSYAVTERTREMGIRIAIGAVPSRVILLVVRQGMLLVGIGMLFGVIGAIGMGAGLASIMYGVTAIEPIPLFGMTLLLTLVALLANYLPALRVSKQDPVSALRYE